MPDFLSNFLATHFRKSTFFFCAIWWPGISRGLERLVQSCTECCKAQCTERWGGRTNSPHIQRFAEKSNNPIYLALLAYHTMPLEVGYSSFELLMSPALRSTAPTIQTQRAPQTPQSIDTVRAIDYEIKARHKKNVGSQHAWNPNSTFSRAG